MGTHSDDHSVLDSAWTSLQEQGERLLDPKLDWLVERSELLKVCHSVERLDSDSDLQTVHLSGSLLVESERRSVSAMEWNSGVHLERSKALRLECQWVIDSGSRSDLKSDHKWAANLDSWKEKHLGSHSDLK